MKRILFKAIFILTVLFMPFHAYANVCSQNQQGRTSICGEEAGQCYYQVVWGGTSVPAQITDENSACCYDPATYECGAGVYLNDDTVVTPVVTQKVGIGSTSFGTQLKACGIIAIAQSSTCTKDASCTIIGYPEMCPLSYACTNDVEKCAEFTSTECPGVNNSSCGGVCYDNRDNFCFEHEIYSKDTHFKCADELYNVSSTQTCCHNRWVYNSNEQICTSDGVFSRDTYGSCNGRSFVLATHDCSNRHIVDKGNLWDTACKDEYNPETHECQKGAGIAPRYEFCEIGQRFALNQCYSPGTASFGDECVANDQCEAGKCTGTGGLSKGECVCKTDNDCGDDAVCKKGPLGIGKNQCIATSEPTCPAGSTYEIRNPLNRDRCNITTVETRPLQCKLGAFDKKKNWTGPHAQSGEDECRSTKGKDPKGVKCPAGFTHNITSGADTCTKTSVSHQTPTCPSGWNYKSQNGRDICEDK